MSALYFLVLLGLFVVLAWIGVVNSRTSRGLAVISPVTIIVAITILTVLVPSAYLVEPTGNAVWLSIAAGFGLAIGLLLLGELPKPTALVMMSGPAHLLNPYLRAMPVLLGLMTLVTLVRFSGPPPILPILSNLIQGGAAADMYGFAAESRSQATTAGWFNQEAGSVASTLAPLCYVGWPFFAVIALGALASAKQQAFRVGTFRTYFVVATLGTIVGAGGDLVRASLGWAVFTILTGYFLIHPPKGSRLVLSGSILFGAMMLLTAITNKAQGASSPFALAEIVARRFGENFINDVLLHDLVGSGQMQFTYGTETLNSLISTLPGVRVGVPLDIQLERLSTGTDTVWFATGTAVGRLYIDWALPGVFIGFAAAGVVAALVHRRLFGSAAATTPVGLAARTSTIIVVGQFPLTGFVGTTVNLLIVVTMRFVAEVILRHFLIPAGEGSIESGLNQSTRANRGSAR